MADDIAGMEARIEKLEADNRELMSEMAAVRRLLGLQDKRASESRRLGG